MDLSGETAEVHMRTDANNLVSTAGTTHLPEQQETIHMIQMLRKEACSGAIEDLAHVRTEHCLSDSLTKTSVNPDALIQTVETGVIVNIDCYKRFRELLQHKAFLEYCNATSFLSDQPAAIKDYYEVKGQELTRHIVNPRRRHFSPLECEEALPFSVSCLFPTRTTSLTWSNGDMLTRHDNWTSPTAKEPWLWTGTVTFMIKEE